MVAGFALIVRDRQGFDYADRPIAEHFAVKSMNGGLALGLERQLYIGISPGLLAAYIGIAHHAYGDHLPVGSEDQPEFVLCDSQCQVADI